MEDRIVLPLTDVRFVSKQTINESEFKDIIQDPVATFGVFWPHYRMYDLQQEILYSVRDNDETIVPAANAMGKDFISGYCALWWFLSRIPARVVTTSVDHSQLKGVLWGEMRRFLAEAKYDLPLHVNDLMIRILLPNGQFEPRSELIGRVAKKGEGLLGRHLEQDSVNYDLLDKIGLGAKNDPGEHDPAEGFAGEHEDYEKFGEMFGTGTRRCLVIFDEASGMEDSHYDSTDTWAHSKLVIGNCYECENFFRRKTEAGDVVDPSSQKDGGKLRYYTKVIHIPAEKSPNVRLAIEEKKLGKEPSGRVIIPGVMTYATYNKRRNTWPERKQVIGLDAQFYDGAETKLYPKQWRREVNEIYKHVHLFPRTNRRRWMGIDVAEGGDETVWTIIDELALLKQVEFTTPDTSVIPGHTIGLMNEWDVDPSDVCMDRGGGGKEHVDRLRSLGYAVRSVGFGESANDASIMYKKFARTSKRQIGEFEDRYTFKNRRSQMYFFIRLAIQPAPVLLDENGNIIRVIEDGVPTDEPQRDPDHKRLAIPAEYEELDRQMQKIPLLYDKEGQIILPPKNGPTKDYTGDTLSKMLGRSPDQLDSLALAVYSRDAPRLTITAGGSFVKNV